MMAAASPSERQPLLPHSQVVVRSDCDESTDIVRQPAKDFTWRWYAFYGLLFALNSIALTMLIKGFIDAGDKDVS